MEFESGFEVGCKYFFLSESLHIIMLIHFTYFFFQISAKTGTGVNDIFKTVIQRIPRYIVHVFVTLEFFHFSIGHQYSVTCLSVTLEFMTE